jgi:hypothetical protein
MLSASQKELLLKRMVDLLELPDSAYERAKARYEDLGEFFGRDGAATAAHDPKIFPQGSFRLGTVIRPINEGEAYDLDLSCDLRRGISKGTHTQQALKLLVGRELEAYRQARQIQQRLEEKHRCWRLEYADQLNFHMDVVPCMPADDATRQALTKSMVGAGREAKLSAAVSALAVSITDNQSPTYTMLSDDWPLSNTEGYARWFEAVMRVREPQLLEKRAQVDELPIYRRKTPLQRTIQLLKRHRDQMYKDAPASKPISTIITTLAADGYDGDTTLEGTLRGALGRLTQFAESGRTYLANPVNPAENFADKWTKPECQRLRLRDNFVAWAAQARRDFEALLNTEDADEIVKREAERLAVREDAAGLRKSLGLPVAPAVHVGKSHEVPRDSAQPWSPAST